MSLKTTEYSEQNDVTTLREPAPEKQSEVKTPTPEATKEPAKKSFDDFDDGGEMDLLNDLKKQTDKDVEKTATVENTVDKDGGTTSTVTTTEVKRSSTIHYQNHQLVAKLTVAALSVGMGIVLQMVADDWSEEGEKKYTLSNARKAEILEPLELVLEQSKSKYNPVVVLVITVVLAYVPMIITAMRSRKAKNVKKKIVRAVDNVANEVEEVEELAAELPINKKEIVISKSQLSASDISRIKKIKSKRGNRSQEDKDFINKKGLTGLI